MTVSAIQPPQGLRDLVSRLPSMSSRLDFEDESVVLSDCLGYGELQALRIAALRLCPHLDWAALTDPELTSGALNYWLEGMAHEPSGIRRDTYRTTAAFVRSLDEGDLVPLYRSSFEPQLAHRWRFRGRTLSPEAFREAVYASAVLAQLVVSPTGERQGIALVSAYDADLIGGHAHVAVQRFGPRAPGYRGLGLHGLFLFINYVFDHFGLRKLYLELPTFNEYLVAGLEGVLLVEEGRLRNHYSFSGDYHDQVIYAIYREAWENFFLRVGGEAPPSAS